MQDAAVAAAAEAPPQRGRTQQRRGRGLAILGSRISRERGERGTGNGLRFYGGAADAETTLSRKRDAVSGTGTGNGKRIRTMPNLI